MGLTPEQVDLVLKDELDALSARGKTAPSPSRLRNGMNLLSRARQQAVFAFFNTLQN
jgi:hypothetical protein